jgi:hypothetical protein
MILQIHSQNPHLLDLLNKNPHTDLGIYAKSLRNGQLIGNAVSAYQYDVVFQDTRYSYLPEESNQIDFQSYCSPLVILHICNEFFKELLQEKQVYWSQQIKWLERTRAEVDTYPCTIEVKNLYANSTWYSKGHFMMERYFKNIHITPIVGNNLSLRVEGKSVFEAMNLLSFIAVTTHITNTYGEYTYIDDHFAQKYARILTNIPQVPYFVFYLFIKRAIKSERQFAEIKPMFEAYFKTEGLDIDFQFADTHGSRMDFIVKELGMEYPILDIGCGELKYYRRFMRRNYNYSHPYFATDTDKSVGDYAALLKERMEADNLYFFSDWADYEYKNPVNIILTEVIEHNTPEAAEALVKHCLSLNFHKMIITTPNSLFNKYYFDEDPESLRHEDHHFEWTPQEFQDFIHHCVGDTSLEVTYYGIGDRINGETPTQAVVITRK